MAARSAEATNPPPIPTQVGECDELRLVARTDRLLEFERATLYEMPA